MHACHEADLQVHVERVDGVEVIQLRRHVMLRQRKGDRRLHKGVNLLVETHSREETADEIERRVDDALAQLRQMLQQAHPGQIGALAHRGASAIHNVLLFFLGINHDERLRPPVPREQLRACRLLCSLWFSRPITGARTTSAATAVSVGNAGSTPTSEEPVVSATVVGSALRRWQRARPGSP